MRKSLLTLAAVAALALSAAPMTAQPQPPATKERTDSETLLAQAQAKLAWALIERLAANGRDVTVSPASLTSAFGIIALGADPAMKIAIARVLGFGPEHIEAGLATLSDARGKLTNASNMLQPADRIVFSPTTPPNQILRAGLESLGIAYSIDNLAIPEVAARIDAWVREVTQGAIPEILGGPLDHASFVALNAMHFKGRWRVPFDPQLTSTAPFAGADGQSENVAMMQLNSQKHLFRKEHNFIAIDLPFAEERFSLTIVTTTDKPAPASKFAKVAGWLTGAGFTSQSGSVSLPRFSTSGREDLVPVLDALGLDKARHSKTALQGFAPGAMLSQVLQNTMIKVDEEGTEAAAATAATIGIRSLQNDDVIHMNVDRPFIFALRDSVTGLILAAGYVGHAPKPEAA